MDMQNLTLDVEQHIDIQAAVGDVFEGLLRRLSDRSTMPDGTPMPLVLERWPGGRWFRDLGDSVGHLWGFVQVIKPPTLLEMYGPMFMSYPVSSHLAMRLEQVPGGTRVTLRHRALGLIEEEHRMGVNQGWKHYLESLKTDCE